jgi:hypothetical protein
MKTLDILTQYDSITFLACNDIRHTLSVLNNMGIDISAIDYDPKFKDQEFYINKDFIFDDIKYSSELVVHMNCEKTYPEIRHCGDVLLRGDNLNYHGDCNPIYSTNQLIEQFNLKDVYQEHVVEGEDITCKNLYLVWGRM